MPKLKTAVFLLRNPKRLASVLGEKRDIYRAKVLGTQVPPEFYFSLKNRIRVRYKRIFGRYPNLFNPQLYTEKVQWRKLYCPDIKKIASVTDKAGVYEYVKSRISEEHLLAIIWLGGTISPEEVRELGDGIVLQPTHRSGQVIFIERQDEVDADVISEKLNEMMKWPYSIIGQEPWYGYSKPRIIARPLVRNSDGSPYLNDCKIHAFKQADGSFKLICEIINTYPHWRAIFSENFERLNFEWSPDMYPPPDFEVDKPKAFDAMVKDAKALAADFDYVRVDFMVGAHEYYFTELTFAPAGGHPKMDPPEWDAIVGSYWNLDTGNYLKRCFWFFRTWAPLWKTERPARCLRLMHKSVNEIYIPGIKPINYQKKYLRLNNQKLKVAILTRSIGAPKTLATRNFYTNWIRGFRQNQVDAVCYAQYQKEKPVVDVDILNGELLQAPFKGVINPLDLMISDRPDIIICHNNQPLVSELAKTPSQKSEKRFVSSGESLTRAFEDLEKRKEHVRLVNEKFDGLIAVSDFLASEWREEGFCKPIYVTRTPISAEASYSHEGSSTGLHGAYFGNLHHQDIDNLLEITKIVLGEIPNFHLSIYGDSDEAGFNLVTEKIQSLGLNAAVSLHGSVSFEEMQSIQSKVDVLLLPREKATFSDAGFPNKLGEYLASACPIGTTKVSNIETIISHKEHAYIVEPGENIQFAQAVIECLRNSGSSISMEARARKFIMEYASSKEVAADFLRWVNENYGH